MQVPVFSLQKTRRDKVVEEFSFASVVHESSVLQMQPILRNGAPVG